MKITDEQIQKHKARHKNIYLITVEGETKEEENIEFLFKQPDRKILAAAGKFAASNPLQAADIMMQSCLLEGDKNALEDTAVFTAVAAQFEEINKPRESAIKKL